MRRTFHKSSDFREQIELIKYALTFDDAGGTTPTYQTSYSTFAKVKPYDGNLSIQGAERVGNNKFEFTIRYRNSLTYEISNLWDEFFTSWSENSQYIDKTYKIGYRGKEYIIHSVIIEDERNYYLKIVGWLRS
jgi:SPP1 family predicted phage head-tail adaptor